MKLKTQEHCPIPVLQIVKNLGWKSKSPTDPVMRSSCSAECLPSVYAVLEKQGEGPLKRQFLSPHFVVIDIKMSAAEAHFRMLP